MVRHAGAFLALAAVFMLASCGTIQVGRNFDAHAFETKIERGTTTQKQVAEWLGEPISTGVAVENDGERFDQWTYYFASAKLVRISDSEFKMLQIKFDKNGIARGYQWSDSTK